MAKITYLDKVALNENTDIPDNNKVKANDMNEIKQVVNTNDANVGNIADLNTEDISNIVNAINEVNDKLNYSTEEQRIGTWIGKPLYRKVVYLNTLPNNATDVRYATGITTNIDVIKMYGKAYNTSNNRTFPLPFVGANFIGWVYDNSTNEILITTTIDRSSLIGYATIEYTKTTD